MRNKLIRDKASNKALRQLRDSKRAIHFNLYRWKVNLNVSDLNIPQGNKDFLERINDPNSLSWVDQDTGKTTPFVAN